MHLAFAFALAVGVVPSTQKVRPDDQPTTTPAASIKAARNEFEAFQIVLRADTTDVTQVSARLSQPLGGMSVVLYAERYYNVGTASNDEGAPGPWPDPLVPDKDTYFGETRNAFPITVPAGKTRVIWVDVLVPIDQAPGEYTGEIEISSAGAKVAAVPITLRVGNFTLPSTATLRSAFGMGWDTAPRVHCGGAFPFCGGSEDKSVAIRSLYLRSALEHRFTISDSDFQPPFGGSAKPFEDHVLPLILGTANTRLPGARLTTVRLDGGMSSLAQWIAYAKQKNFFDRLFYYPVDEPGNNAAQWTNFKNQADALHAADPTARIVLTTTLAGAASFLADSKLDIVCPVLDEMWGRPGTTHAGDQRSKYDAWLAASSQRSLWMYQSCDQHGCGACGTPSTGSAYTGWPQRVIDSSGVQDRAFQWLAWKEKTSGELYFETTWQLATAWNDNGQCDFSGSGDGTLFYPGKPSIIGGTQDIPIESIRMKLIREGMEDYEYLAQVAQQNPALAQSVTDALFPSAYDCDKTPAALEAARDTLFDALDVPLPPGADLATGGAADLATGNPDPPSGGCACRISDAGGAPLALLVVIVGLAISRGTSRWRAARQARRRTSRNQSLPQP